MSNLGLGGIIVPLGHRVFLKRYYKLFCLSLLGPSSFFSSCSKCNSRFFVFLSLFVHHQAERKNIFIFNITRCKAPSDVALNRAIGYAERLCNSSFTLTSKHTVCVCVGLNFNVNLDPFSVDTVELQQDKFPLVQRLFERLSGNK